MLSICTTFLPDTACTLLERRDEIMKKIYTHPEMDFIKLSAEVVLSASTNVYQYGDIPDALDPWGWD